MLEIGGLVIHAECGFDIDQAYEYLGGESVMRAMNGRAIKQQTWSKLRVVTSGSGWAPACLDSLDYAAQMVLKCVIPTGIFSNASRQAILPAGRRSDAEHFPFAWAYTPSGRVMTPISISGNVVTCDAVPGAISYQVMYYPQITVYAMRPTHSGNSGDASYAWKLVCEEV